MLKVPGKWLHSWLLSVELGPPEIALDTSRSFSSRWLLPPPLLAFPSLLFFSFFVGGIRFQFLVSITSLFFDSVLLVSGVQCCDSTLPYVTQSSSPSFIPNP